MLEGRLRVRDRIGTPRVRSPKTIGQRLARALLAGVLSAAIARVQTPERVAACPPPTDTLSLLQPSDAAYRDTPAVKRFLEQRGFVVRCITRSTAGGAWVDPEDTPPPQ